MEAAELRPMSLGEILDRTFTLYRNHFLLFVGIAALPNLILLFLNLGVQALGMVSTGKPSASPEVDGAAILVGLVGGLLFLVVLWMAIVFSQAATVFAVSEVHLGRPTSIGQSYARVKGHFWQMFGVLFAVGIRIFIGLILFIIPGILWMLKYSLSVPAAMLEDVGASAAMDRSAKLTEGSKGRIFLIFLLMWILAYVALLIFQVPVGILMVMAGKDTAQIQWLTAISHLTEFLANSLTGPIGTIAFALLYYDERIRKEAFDLQLMMQMLDGTPPSPGGVSPMAGTGGASVPRQIT